MKNNIKHIWLIALFIAMTPHIFAAESSDKYESDVETRVFVAVKKSFLNKSLNVEFSPEARFGGSSFDYDKTLLKFAVDYDIFNWFNVGVGYRATFNKTKKRGTETTGRLDFDLSKSIKAGKFRIKPRVRFSDYQEYKNTKDIESSYMRYKVGIGYKYGKKAIFEPEIGAEMFHNLSSGYISSMRYNIGGDFRITKNNFIGINYMVETEFKTRILKHIAEVGYTYKF
ncbi:MAG: DUF2490 domain-containing protein [Rikenellaceae bacterium]